MKIFLVLGLCLLSNVVLAGAGHNHGDEAAAVPVAANAPQRLPDGSIFLPKPAQRFMAVRTQITQLANLPQTVRLNGQVVASANATGKVLALQTGRLQALDNALPQVGDSLKQGQALAKIVLAKDSQEGTNQAVEAADLAEQLKLARLEYQRLQRLGELIPRNEIDAAKTAVHSLQARLAVFKRGGKAQESLYAPLSGVVSAVYAADGQAVQAGEPILEVIDPSRLLVEALSFEPSLVSNIAAATLVLGQQTIPLNYQGTARRLRQQALPLRFRAAGQGLAGLAEGLPVQVLVQTQKTLSGVAIPADALARNGSNQTIVWLKTAPETFQPQVVKYQALDGERVLVTAGLQGNERVVVQATTLLNQIR